MFRLVRLRRFPRINLTICLLIYCFLGVLYLMTFSTKNQTILMTTVENYEYESKIKFSASKNSQVSKLMQTSTPPVLQKKLFYINYSAENGFYDHPRNPIFPLQGALKNPQPLFKMGDIEINSDLIIGIPTIRRIEQDYLLKTLHSLLNTQQAEEATVHIVVFIAETNLTYIEEMSKKIHSNFKNYIEVGKLQVISPPVSYYPSWRYTINVGFNDTFDRVKWRSKQNLDHLFLMMYAYQYSPTYYLMMEDDVIAMKGYDKKILTEANHRSSSEYFFLSFCSLGAIGKLFQTSNLPPFASFVHLFWNKKPIDWLMIDYVTVTYCGYDEEPRKCMLRRNTKLPYVTPALFQHIGIYSSLSGKLQILRDESFENAKYYNGSNTHMGVSRQQRYKG